MSQNVVSTLVVLAVIAIGVIGYYIGLSVGKEEGYTKGYIKGSNEQVDKLYAPKSSEEQVNYPKSNVTRSEHRVPRQTGGRWT